MVLLLGLFCSAHTNGFRLDVRAWMPFAAPMERAEESVVRSEPPVIRPSNPFIDQPGVQVPNPTLRQQLFSCAARTLELTAALTDQVLDRAATYCGFVHDPEGWLVCRALWESKVGTTAGDLIIKFAAATGNAVALPAQALLDGTILILISRELSMTTSGEGILIITLVSTDDCFSDRLLNNALFNTLKKTLEAVPAFVWNHTTQTLPALGALLCECGTTAINLGMGLCGYRKNRN